MNKVEFISIIRRTYIYVIAILFASCSNSNTSTEIYSNQDSIRQIPIQEIDTGNISINATLPFGSLALTKIKYPHYWAEDYEHYERSKSPEAKELENISTELSKINIAAVIYPPKIDSIEYIDLNKSHSDYYYFDTIAVKTLDSCLYRLPNIGIYQCFYFRANTIKISYGVYGNLLLLNPKTKIGKALTIYFEYGGDQNVSLRYFCIDKDAIKIYEGSCYDDGTRMNQTFTITIDPSGAINIKNHSQGHTQ